MLDNDLHGVADIAALHAFDGHDLRCAVRPDQVDLRVPVAEHMNVGRCVIIDKDDEAQAMGAIDGDRASI